MEQVSSSVMVATLGGQPQVITFALDELIARGFYIREVIVLYLSAEGSRVNRALDRLLAEFEGDQYQGRPCRLRPIPIRNGLTRLPDIRSDQDAIITSEVLRDLMVDLKRQYQQLHVCLSGGRRMMALLLVPLAMTTLGYGDRLWHIYTPEEFQTQARDGKIMHARPEDGVRLLRVPFVPLGALGGLTTLDPPGPHPDETEWQRCRAVWNTLSPRQRDVLRLLAGGLAPQQVAEKLSISIKTFNSHNSKILAECRLAWTLPEEQWLDYHFIKANFGPFLDRF
ncbi:MAG: histidine kinase [Anaerolineae bacterium]|nr:histidine kinase [Anaerolineae bacterium]